MGPLDSLNILQTGKYMQVSSLALLVYDYLITLDLEVELVWKPKWSVIKVLFFLCRYSALIDVPLMVFYDSLPGLSYNERSCRIINIVSESLILLGLGSAEAILCVRTYALWGNERRIGIFLSVFFFACYIPEIILVALYLHSVKFFLPIPGLNIPALSGCWPLNGLDRLFALFMLLLISETVVIILTLCAWIWRYRHARTRLFQTLYRDSILYFGSIFLASAANVIMMKSAPREYVSLLAMYQRVLHSVLSARVLLHVREASLDDPIVGRRSISALQFGSSNGTTMVSHHQY